MFSARKNGTLALVEGAIIYRVRGGTFWLFSVLAVFFLLGAVGLAASNQLAAAPSLFFCGMFAYAATKQTRRVELHPDGTLFIHFWTRPTRKIEIRDVQRIVKHNDNGRWTVEYRDDGSRKLELDGTDTAAWLVHSLIRRRPKIKLVGYTIPPL